MAILNRILRVLAPFDRIVTVLAYIGIVLLFLWMCFTFYDVVARYLFSSPTSGTVEIGEMALVLITFLGVGYAQLRKAHIKVDLITCQLSPKAAIVADIATYIICTVVVAVLAWQGIVNTMDLAKYGLDNQLNVPIEYIAVFIPIGCFFYGIILIKDVFTSIVEGLKARLDFRHWFLAFGISLIIIILLGLWMYNPALSRPMVGLLGLLMMLVFIFLGMPISIAMAILAFTFVGHIVGPNAGFQTVGSMMYTEVADYSWVTVILFVLMSYFVLAADLGTDLFDTAYKWIGHVPGGVAVATIGGSTAMASVVGDAVASTLTVGSIALPEMKKYGYNDGLAGGSIAAGATLGPLIPPSVPLIIYGILSSTSIGALFVAGIIPGLMLAASFMITIYILCRYDKTMSPTGAKSNWTARIRSLKSAGPVLVLFIIVIGGIYIGVFSAMEGGAIGSFITFVIGLSMKRMTWKKLVYSLIESVKLGSALVFMIACTLSFGRLIGASNLSTMLVDTIVSLNVPPLAVIAVFLLSFVVLGCFMSAGLVIILTVPLLTPILTSFGIDLVWFGVLMIIIANLGLMTPPYGMLLFIIRNMAPYMSFRTLSKGVIPFVISTIIISTLLFIFPSLVTWLPSLMW